MFVDLEVGCFVLVGVIVEVVEFIDEDGCVFEELLLCGCVVVLDGFDVICVFGIGSCGWVWELGFLVVVELFELGVWELMWGVWY